MPKIQDSRGFDNYLQQMRQNHLYWLFVDIVYYKSILRLLALFSILSVPIIIYKLNAKFSLKKSRYKSIILLWLTFPAAWWYGKLVAPELYCLALGLWGLYFAIPPEKSERRKMIGILLMGIAIGIKVTFVIFPIFYYCYTSIIAFERGVSTKNIIQNIKRYIFREEKLGIVLVIGFLLGSPSIIWEPKLYFDHLTQFSSPGINFSSVKYLYSPSVGSFWETIISPSLTWFSMSLVSIIFLIIFYDKWSIENKKIAYSFFISFLVSLFLLMKSKIFFLGTHIQ